MTKIVSRMVPELEFAQFQDPDDRERLLAIRSLAQEQVDDDNEHPTPSRVGRRAVQSYMTDWLDVADPLYAPRSPDERALEEGFEPLLISALTGEQRVLVRWRYGARYTEREIATFLNISQPAVHYRLEAVHARLREALLAAFGPSGDLTEESS